MPSPLHPEVLAFLEDIKEKPQDDTPRLVLADWLDEYGATEADRGRGEFLRVQCQRSRLFWADPQRRELGRREHELCSLYDSVWLVPWKQQAEGWWFERGLLRLKIDNAGRLPSQISSSGPWCWVDGVRVRNPSRPDVVWLIESGVLGLLNYLDLAVGRLSTRQLRTLASCPEATRLSALVLARNRLDTRAARVLGESQYLRRLVHLDLSDNRLGPTGAQVLALSPHLTGLTTLDLAQNAISDDGVTVLMGAPVTGNLTFLSLRNNRLGPVSAEVIASSPSLSNLQSLSLGANRIGDQGALALANSRYLSNLISLRLDNTGIHIEGADALLSSPHLKQLTTLDLQHNPVADSWDTRRGALRRTHPCLIL
jgi:uncharacterized protein (TIGR02996 family)